VAPKTAFPIAGSAATANAFRDWLGGWHLGIQPSEQETIRIIRTALDGGSLPRQLLDYNDGASEIRMGKAYAAATARRPSS